MSDVVRREDAEAALRARRELAPEYEDQVVDAFGEQIEARLAKRGETTPKPRNHEPLPLSSRSHRSGWRFPCSGLPGGRPGSPASCSSA